MEPLADDEINEHNLRHLANCDDRVTLSAMVQPHHVEAAAWAVAEIESLRQQLADVTAERDTYASALRRCAVAATVSDSATEDEAVQAAGKAAFGTELDRVDDIVSDRIADLIFDAAQVASERDRLRAELLQQPPTLEWLRETFGEPVVLFHGMRHEYANGAIVWVVSSKFAMRSSKLVGGEYRLATRAAVLAAVAETKGANDGK